MSADDKAQNTGEKLAGKAKEAFGKATGDDSKVAEGETQQSGASAKQAGENIKDVFKK
ncbi:CsbD family protein [Clavibacter michiganensis]|uniref:CsbD-like protein n=1 Tax=Clavibacter michiganensis TaxID=28447 RepID=A0A251YJX3_9MICO|nr:CsbD family protein [Clavibacter michiganensis]OUE24524.1 CsbD-like protein [Clavibacter michiganensis]